MLTKRCILPCRYPLGLAGGMILGIFVLMAIFANIIAPLDPADDFNAKVPAPSPPPGSVSHAGRRHDGA